MKANKAPEKIYLNDSMTTDTVGELYHEWFDAKVSDRSIEYTRTDAFIEKAIKFFSPYIQDNSGGYDIERVIEDFKNYMKGE